MGFGGEWLRIIRNRNQGGRNTRECAKLRISLSFPSQSSPEPYRPGASNRGHSGLRGPFAGMRLPRAFCPHGAPRSRAAPLSLHPSLGTDPGLTCASASALAPRTAGRGVSGTLGWGREGVFPRGVGVIRGEAPDSRASRAGQALPLKSEASAADPPAEFGISRAGTSSRTLGGRGWRRGWVTLQPRRDEAAGPRKRWTAGLTPSPCCPQTRVGQFQSPCGYLVSAPSSWTYSPLPPRAPCAHTAQAGDGVRRFALGGRCGRRPSQGLLPVTSALI